MIRSCDAATCGTATLNICEWWVLDWRSLYFHSMRRGTMGYVDQSSKTIFHSSFLKMEAAGSPEAYLCSRLYGVISQKTVFQTCLVLLDRVLKGTYYLHRISWDLLCCWYKNRIRGLKVNDVLAVRAWPSSTQHTSIKAGLIRITFSAVPHYVFLEQE